VVQLSLALVYTYPSEVASLNSRTAIPPLLPLESGRA